LWPPLRAAAAGRPDRVALVDALEAEHAVIEPLLAAIDAAAADPDYGYQRFGDTIDELSAKLTAHLAHEEADGLPLIDASLTPRRWPPPPRPPAGAPPPAPPNYTPGLPAAAPPPPPAAAPGTPPPPLLPASREQWAPAYAALKIWPANGEPEP